jgi:mRNA interferase MazF
LASYVPEQGDFIALTLDPQVGHEQMGRRPALVVSKTLFNERTGLAIVCPLTTAARRHLFHVTVPDSLPVGGFVMVEQVKSIDYRGRGAKPIGKASEELLDQVLAVLDACIY